MMANAKLKHRLEQEGVCADHIRDDTAGVAREIWSRDGVAGFWRGAHAVLVVLHGCDETSVALPCQRPPLLQARSR